MAAWIVTWERWRLAGVFTIYFWKHAGETPALPGPNLALVAAWPRCERITVFTITILLFSTK